MIASDIVNVKRLIDAIKDNENTVFRLLKNGNYSHLTYKQMLSEILFPHEYVTIEEMVYLIHERVHDVIREHVYYSKSAKNV